MDHKGDGAARSWERLREPLSVLGLELQRSPVLMHCRKCKKTQCQPCVRWLRMGQLAPAWTWGHRDVGQDGLGCS